MMINTMFLMEKFTISYNEDCHNQLCTYIFKTS